MFTSNDQTDQSDSSFPSGAPNTTSVVDTPAGLADIDQTGLHLVAWRRADRPTWLDDLRETLDDLSPFDARANISVANPDFSDLSTHLPTSDIQSGFEEDAHNLLARLVELSPARQIDARLELTDHQNCPKFHVDNNALRLICTYAGPGTEWLPARDVASFEDQTGGHLHGPADDVDAVRRAQTGDIVLLEGKDRFAEEGPAPLHRSPWLDNGECRLVFKLTAARASKRMATG